MNRIFFERKFRFFRSDFIGDVALDISALTCDWRVENLHMVVHVENFKTRFETFLNIILKK